MSRQPFSRADRNRIRRGRRTDRPRAAGARAPWATNVVRREHPGRTCVSLGEYLKLIYDERDVARVAMRRHPLFRRIARTP